MAVPEEPAPTPAETVIVVEDPTAVEPSAPSSTPTDSLGGEDGRALKPQTIAPDPALMESMECLPVPDQTLEFAHTSTQAGFNKAPLIDSAMVEVGEGLTPGEVWWLIALHYEERKGSPTAWDTEFVRLTNQPGLSSGERGMWIQSRQDDLGRYMWQHVKWQDEESFARLQSAASKALSCLDSG